METSTPAKSGIGEPKSGASRSGASLSSEKRALFLPLLFTAAILVADQALKAAIVALIRQGNVGWTFGGDFFWLVHARNLGVAFSIGYGLPEMSRRLLFILMPALMIGGILVFYFGTRSLSALQRWLLCGIVGGGLGNLLDRAFRPDGVVDFLSVKFYGLFGLDRWPTFNLADASVLVCGIALVITGSIPDNNPDKKPGIKPETEKGKQ